MQKIKLFDLKHSFCCPFDSAAQGCCTTPPPRLCLHCQAEGDSFLSQIVRYDEMWCSHLQPMGKTVEACKRNSKPLPNVRTEDSSICGVGHFNFFLISVDCCYWCSRTLTSPSIQSSIVGPSETFMPLSRDNVLACSWGALSCCMMNTYPHVAHTLCWTIPCTAWTV